MDFVTAKMHHRTSRLYHWVLWLSKNQEMHLGLNMADLTRFRVGVVSPIEARGSCHQDLRRLE